MRFNAALILGAAATCIAQGDLGALLQTQDDLSTLLDLVGFVDGLAEILSGSSNITIFAPTNEAFKAVPRDIPEGEAIEFRNNTIAVGALLANHVFKGIYPANSITDVPKFVQSLLNDSYVDARQPFSNFTGGAYNALVQNGDQKCVLSGEQTISTVTEADIKLGDGIIIHKIDTVLSFGAPLQLFAYRAGYTAFNAAVEAANLQIDFGDSGATQSGLNISDFTVFVPTNEAFERIGSVLESADMETLRSVLQYHFIPNNVIFSPSLGNVTVPSLQGQNLTITVLPDGSAYVNDAKIVFANTILYNGVAHVIDNVLSPEGFNRSSIEPSEAASDRVAFPNATSVSELPFSSVSYANDMMQYTTTAALLQTAVAALPASKTKGDSRTGTGTSPGTPTDAEGPGSTFPLPGVHVMAYFLAAALLL